MVVSWEFWRSPKITKGLQRVGINHAPATPSAPAGADSALNHAPAPYGQKWLTDICYMKTFCSFWVANTNSARQVEFTKCKSSPTGIELVQRLSKVPRESLVDYKVPHSESNYCYTSYTMRIDDFYFLSCRSWWTVSMLIPTAPFLDCVTCVPVRGLYGPLHIIAP